MKFSIVIPNLNSPIIDQTINALVGQHLESQYEIIIVGLDEPGLVKESSRVRFICTGKPVWAAVARNIGLKMARGEIICFLDADCIPRADWLSRIEEQFRDPQIFVLGGVLIQVKQDFGLSAIILVHSTSISSVCPLERDRSCPVSI